MLRTLLAIVLFSLTASSAYLLNDIVDVANDRIHPEKRRRPFASGQLSLVVGWIVWPALAALSLALALVLLPWEFAAVLTVYFAVTLTYSFWAKRKGVLDVIVLGGLYTIRLIAGGAAIAVPLTMWLITFSMLFFLSLALVKRVSELSRVRRTGATIPRPRISGQRP
ncbi:MAG: UbiA family prenyltransferase [Aeromicrobium sp.]